MKNVSRLAQIFFVSMLVQGCTTAPLAPVKEETPPLAKTNCDMVSERQVLANQTVNLPASGLITLESHLATDQEGWPSSVTSGMKDHLSRSCEALKKRFALSDCSAVYPGKYNSEWTPSEGGKIGQGSSRKPTVVEEMWILNQMYTAASKPKPGEKFLVCANNKCFVAAAGLETGPGSSKFLGGMQSEGFWYLGLKYPGTARIGRLKDQSVPYGPINCE